MGCCQCHNHGGVYLLNFKMSLEAATSISVCNYCWVNFTCLWLNVKRLKLDVVILVIWSLVIAEEWLFFVVWCSSLSRIICSFHVVMVSVPLGGASWHEANESRVMFWAWRLCLNGPWKMMTMNSSPGSGLNESKACEADAALGPWHMIEGVGKEH